MQRVAIVGFGFMGGMHAQVYGALSNATVVAIVDAYPDAVRDRAWKLGLEVPIYSEISEMLSGTECDVIDICLPTDLHKSAVLPALAAKKHVFCEKPLALSVQEGEEILRAADAAGVSFQVGHCIRFWPEYQAFADFFKSGQAGKLRSLTMQRRSCQVTGTENWLQDEQRSLGAVLDLHIHDTDWVHHLLGTPKAVTSRGTRDASGWTHVFTDYHFDDVVVQAEGGWNYPAQWGFQMAFQAVFADGAVEYDSRATPSLRAVVGKDEPFALPFEAPGIGASVAGDGNVSSLGGYYNELAYFIDCLERGESPKISTGTQALQSVRTVIAEVESLKTGQTVLLEA